MKTLKFVIPRTAASVAALIDSLSTELVVLGGQVVVTTIAAPAPGSAAVDTSKTDEQDNTNKDDNVVDINSAKTTAANVVVVAPGEKATGVAGIVEIDSDGIPWDARIHAGSKATLKRGGTWKIARNTDDALVTTVIAELKATMSATGASDTEQDAAPAPAASTTAPPPAASIAPAPAPAPAPEPEVVADPIYIVEGSGEFTSEQLLASGWSAEQIETLPTKPVEAVVNTTSDKPVLFPDLMAAITAADLDEATVLVAVQNQGIQATPLLAARPDLVPAVYAELFPA